MINYNNKIWSLEDLKEQIKDVELQTMTKITSLKPVEITPGIRIICDTRYKALRTFLPQILRRKLFEAYHNIAHPSTRITKRLITCSYVWPTMIKDIRSWCKTCTTCQASKVTQHTKKNLI